LNLLFGGLIEKTGLQEELHNGHGAISDRICENKNLDKKK
jgi:hypothetical protein